MFILKVLSKLFFTRRATPIHWKHLVRLVRTLNSRTKLFEKLHQPVNVS